MANTLNLGTNGNWAVKDGSLLGYNNENNNIKPLPFDFTRASSATRVNKQGLIETVASGVPRIDFTDANGALLLEPQRSNLVTYSESFSGWSIDSPIALTSNSTTSPDGTQNAAKIEYNGSAGYTYFRTTYTAAVGVFSIYAKKGNWRYLGIRNNDGGSHSVWDFDTETFSNVQTNHTMSFDALGNGWYRIMDYVSVDTAGPHRGVAITDTTGTETSPSAPAGSYVYLWGAQGENSTTYATSYIPTQGSAVTVVADACSQDISNITSTNTHTFYWEGIIKSSTTQDGFAITFSTIINSTSVALLLFRGADGKIKFYGNNAGVTLFGSVLSEASVINQDTTAKYALAIEENRLSIYRDGIKIISSTATQTIPSNLKWLQLNYWSGIYAPNQTIYNDLRYYNTALTDAELAALTT
jgi:hypothetical protein